MADNPNAARVGASGKAYVAPTTVTAPVGINTQTGTSPNFTYTPIHWVGFFDLGLISDDGLTESLDSSREEWTPWGYLAPVRSQITKETTTFKFTCWESNINVLSLRYRSPISAFTQYNAKEVQLSQTQNTAPDLRAFGFDIVDGTNVFRYVIPLGEVTDVGDVTYKSNDIVGHEFTVTAHPGSDGVSIRRMMQAGLSLTPTAET